MFGCYWCLMPAGQCCVLGGGHTDSVMCHWWIAMRGLGVWYTVEVIPLTGGHRARNRLGLLTWE
jgi:hypothetical protein